MKRREFLGTTALAGAYLAFGRYQTTLAAPNAGPQLPFDLVAVRGGDPAAMFDRGIEALGGMGAFVKKGQRVLVKPNIGWKVPPEWAGNTNPHLVVRIIEQCKAAGAKEVLVFDHSCDSWQASYKTSGIEEAANQAGAKVAPGGEEEHYQEVAIPNGKVLKKAKVHEALLSADVFINVPILKDHFASGLTIAMKNLMGVVWDRGFFHSHDLHQCIVDIASYRKPDLVVVDAFKILKSYGPRPTSAAGVFQMNTQLLCTDPVVADTVATKLFGRETKAVRHIALAVEQGLNQTDLGKLRTKEIPI